LPRRELIAYRIAAITNAGLLKSLFFSVLMIPDLAFWPAGFLGAFLALVAIDLFRMVVEITAWGMSDAAFFRTRTVCLGLLATWTGYVALLGFSDPDLLEKARSPAAFELAQEFLAAAASTSDSIAGTVMLAPFRIFTAIMLAHSLGLPVIVYSCLAMAMVWTLGKLVGKLDSYFQQEVVLREQAAYSLRLNSSSPATLVEVESQVPFEMPKIPFAFGGGGLAWRQMKAALGYFYSLVISLTVPAVLACLPIAVHRHPNDVLLNVLGALVFYSFVLLPTALKFDFRRDLDRMGVLKTLPIRPIMVVAGQLATPVLLSIVYQMVVLLVVYLTTPVHPKLIVACIVLLFPLNVLIFAVDNLLFLLYPYRVNQEGLTVFLRTTLTFTAKGLMFGVALALIVGWTYAAVRITKFLNEAWAAHLSLHFVFALGIWCFVVVCAGFALTALRKAFVGFDLANDV
ncbi:MAG: hypothetical protein KDA87_21145, partial [Planctomycetales bacterium]|nr:hypothetical protein [Planctomycetales bacterium]